MPATQRPAPSRLPGLGDLVVPAGLFAGGLLILTLASARFGVVDGEGAHLDAAAGYGRLIELLRHGGLGALTRDDVAKELGGARSYPLFPHGAAGFAWLALSRRVANPWVSELFALRLPAVLAAAAVPPLVYALARAALSQRWAILAAILSLLGPRLLVDNVSLGGGAPVVACSLTAVLACRISNRTGALWPTLLSGLSMGCAVSQSWAPLLLFLPPVLRAWRASRAGETGDSGWIRLGTGTLAWLVMGAPVAYACSPSLQPLSTDIVLAVFERTFSPVLTATRALGRLPTELAPPRGHALEALLLAVPSTTLVLGLVALGASVGRLNSLPEATRRSAGWALTHAALVVVWPAVVPRALGSYPWTWQLAVPFVALAAAQGARFLAGFVRREAVLCAACAFEPIVSSLDLESAPAATGWLLSVPGGSVAPFDAAITGAIVLDLAALAGKSPADRPVRVYAPDVSPETWEPLRRYKQLRFAVAAVRSKDDADVIIAIPGKPAPEGAVLVTRKLRGRRTVLTVYSAARRAPARQ